MADRRWLFDGQASGVTVTTGNALSESSDAAATVSAGTGGTIVYDDAWSFPAGGRSVKMTNGTGPNQMRLPHANAHTVGAIDETWRWAAEVPESRVFLRMRHASSGYAFLIGRNTSGRMFLQNSASVTVATGTVGLPTTAGVRFGVTYDLASGANSDITINAYNTAGTLLDTISVANVDLSSASYSILGPEGFNSGATVGVSVWRDSAGLRDGSATLMGPYVDTLDLIADVTATRVSDTSVSVAWTHPSDAPNGVTVARVAGAQVNDGLGRGPGEPDYDPLTIPGATAVTNGLTSSPYVDTVPTSGVYTYWVARTAA